MIITPLVHPSQTNTPPSSTRDVIDLTGLDAFPHATEDEPRVVEGAAPCLKRKRVDSDDVELPPSETYTIQSKAHTPVQNGGLDR